jgi:hypothetical protein
LRPNLQPTAANHSSHRTRPSEFGGA